MHVRITCRARGSTRPAGRVRTVLNPDMPGYPRGVRGFEVLLTLAVVAAFARAVVPRSRGPRWTAYAAPLAASLALVQILAEGPRWQLIPAYALAAGCLLRFLVHLLVRPGPTAPGRAGARALRAVRVTLAVAGAAALLLAVALPVALPVFRFDPPTGPYGIGTVTYHWVQPRPELVTADPDDRRELVAQVWYPAVADPAAPRAPYVESTDSVTHAARLLGLPGFLLSHFAHVTTNAVASAPAAPGGEAYPVLVYLTGRAGFRSANTFQVEELVSHGYVVVGLDQPGVSASVSLPGGRRVPLPNERVAALIDHDVAPGAAPGPEPPRLPGGPVPGGIIRYLAQDVAFTLDRLAEINAADPRGVLTGRLDLARVGVFGVSLGGMNAAEACAREPRIGACLIMDSAIAAGTLAAGWRQPTMFLTRDAATMRLERERSGGWSEQEIAQTLGGMWAAYQRLPAGNGYHVEIPGMFHIQFTDLPYWFPFARALGLTGPLPGRRGLEIVNAYSLAFFDAELRGRPAPLLDGGDVRHPEATLRRR